jgi:hypothetical protein
MSQSVVLICPATVSIEDIGAILSKRWTKEELRCHRGRYDLEVRDSSGAALYVSIGQMTPTEGVRSEYMSNEDVGEDVIASLPDSVFFHALFNDYAFCSIVLHHVLLALIDHQQRIWIDNDYGVLIRADLVLEKLGSDSSWDWRGSSPCSTSKG